MKNKKYTMKDHLDVKNNLDENGYLVMRELSPIRTKLREIMDEKGITITLLAQMSGIGKQRINEILKKRTVPSVAVALKLEYVLGVPLQEIFVLTDEAWAQPLKDDNDESIYVNMLEGSLHPYGEVNEELKRSGLEYYHFELNKFLTEEENDTQKKIFAKKNILKYKERAEKDLDDGGRPPSKQKVNSLAISNMNDYYETNICIRVYEKIGIPFRWIKKSEGESLFA